MNGKPIFKADLFSCPTCGTVDNVGLYQEGLPENSCLFWCNCGRVFALLTNRNGTVTNKKEIYNFSEEDYI